MNTSLKITDSLAGKLDRILGWQSLGIQGRLGLAIGGIVLLFMFASEQWIAHRFEAQSVSEVKIRAKDTADGLINGLNMLMVTGKISDPANRLLIVKKMRDSMGVQQLRVIRAKQVSDQFGPGLPSEQPMDELDNRAVETRKPVFKEIRTPDGRHLLRAVIPFIVSTDFRGTNCLQCHHVKVGSVNGAASMVIDMSHEYATGESMGKWLKGADIVLFISLSLVLAAFTRIIVSRSISIPVEKLRSDILSVKSNYDLSKRAHVTGHPEVDDIAQSFNIVIEALEQANSSLLLFSKIFENSSEAVMVTDRNNEIRLVNDAFTRITGYGSEEVLGKNPRILSSGRQGRPYYQSMWQSINETGHWDGEIWNRGKTGEIFPEWLSINVVRDKSGEITHYVGIFIDITDRKEIERQIHSLAYRDSLTGLANRNLLKDRLEQAMLRANRGSKYVAVMFLDLDQFKIINDSLGHLAGDELLKGVAGRLKANIREGDTLARMGGDEFIVVMPDIAMKDEISNIAGKLLKALFAPFIVDHRELCVSASIGIAIHPDNGQDEVSLLRNADAALYRAKEDGKNCFRFYSEEMNAHATERLMIESDLRLAPERDEFFLHYQPQLDLATGLVTGAEALVRWNHAKEGVIPPSKFIPIAEESGLIVELGEWVLRTACLEAKKWHDRGLAISVAVNLSMRQLRNSDFLQTVKRVLLESKFDPRYLELELTESMLLLQPDMVRGLLEELNLLGIKISIDDFGTGYSSLGHLKNLPIDKIKIDRSFVQDIIHDANDRAIAEAIIAIGHNLNIRIIAEGVETEEQLQFLKNRRCDEIQGYYFSRPIPADRMMDLLISNSAVK